MNENDEKWALFYCSLLKPVIFEEIEPQEVNGFLQKVAEEEVVFPDGKKKCPSVSTLRRKLNLFRKSGFEALARKPRSDRGTPRAHDKAVIEKAVKIKRDLPTRSHITINKFLQKQHSTTVPKSTLYWHLREAGATRIKLGVDKKKVRMRWTRDRTHALWVGDFEEGPYVIHGNEVVPTHLSAFIDCHSRYIVEARYYYRQNLNILIDSLLRAFDTHGTPLELYLDQAKVYQSNALKSICYKLHIHHISRRAGDPPGGGLVEKFFGTVQSQFEAEVRHGHILTLEKLNRTFSAWLEESYHDEVNSETGQSPRQRYEEGITVIRSVDLDAVIPYFMQKETRKVHPDFSDVQLHKRFYRVDKRLRRDKVEVWYDPHSPMDTVLIYSLKGEYLGKGVLHRREKGEDPTPPSGENKQQFNYLELLVQQHDEQLRKNAQGIDYRRAVSKRKWAFTDFASTFARLLGRKGGLTSFSTLELEMLKKAYNRFPQLTKPLLVEAVEASGEKTILAIIFQLQRLCDRKE